MIAQWPIEFILKIEKQKSWNLRYLITMSFLSRLALIGFGVGVSATFYCLSCMFRDDLLPDLTKTVKRIRVSVAKLPEVTEPQGPPVLLEAIDLEKNEPAVCQINNVVPVLRNEMYQKIVACERTFYVFKKIPYHWYITIQGEYQHGKFINPSLCYFRYHREPDFNKSCEGMYYLSRIMTIASLGIFGIFALGV